ncbi:LuxR C-terminal-related transcriptional regulator [Heyndrickxia vini]|uniref:GAF domain-containing protein n=1 Tax=Heyndrickxia vini TaxID=1476025 RepID=A0ABX7E051_9BACI|nr:LuxR C-terminal-related transcriptional regulator [Heyndrickxia vini]QQZ08976.1 GAF domain-containing protein [Heyndrickxia vini]
MAQSLHSYDEITFKQFVLFIKTHHQQLEENLCIYLNQDDTLSPDDKKIIGAILDSFLLFFVTYNIEETEDDFESHIIVWLKSQLSLLSIKSFNLFRLIFEKALITLMIQMKYNRSTSILMCLLSIYSQLIYRFNEWINEDKTDVYSKFSQDKTKLQSLDRLNKLLIRSSGVHDFAHILKKCEEFFSYRRCVFYAYIPWSNQFYGVIGAELPKVQSMKGQLSSRETTIFNTQKAIFLKNPKGYVKDEHIELFNLSSVIFVPLTNKQQVFGWLTFDQLGEEFDCSKEELDFLEEVGNRLGLFLSRSGESTSGLPNLHLTERESEILDLLAEGHDNKKMGKILYLSEHTVRDYVSSLMTKLKAKNRTQVVAYAFRYGLLK